MTFTFQDTANEIHEELGSPTTLAIGVILSWLKGNLGGLNNLIQSGYELDADNNYELVTGLSLIDKVIFKKMYFVYYYDVKLRAVLTAATDDSVIEVSENGATVRRLNKTEQAKVYLNLRNTEKEDLDKMVSMYKINNSSPVSVDGSDTTEGIYDPYYNNRRYPNV